jgi:[CysO sulfur-carrier protein]-S-L-cysteine hydrolase
VPSVRIRRDILDQMLSHAASDPLHECCGLLAGRTGAITAIFPASNAAANPATSYEVASSDHFRIVREMRAANLEHLGIYHSHPRGEIAPSRRDIELAYYPDAAYFILSPAAEAKLPFRAFSIRDGVVSELSIEIF